MTPDEIEKAAIEAGMRAFCDCYHEPDLIKRLTAFKRAHERAILRPIEEAPERTRVLIYDGALPFLAERQGDKWWVWYCISLGTFDLRPWKGHPPTHFRPLPKPEGV